MVRRQLQIKYNVDGQEIIIDKVYVDGQKMIIDKLQINWPFDKHMKSVYELFHDAF